jgi:Mg2+/citrate symporter
MTTIQIIVIILVCIALVVSLIAGVSTKNYVWFLVAMWIVITLSYVKPIKPHSTLQELDKQCTEVAMHTFKTGYLMGIDHLREEGTWNEYRWLHDSTVISNVINNGQNIR